MENKNEKENETTFDIEIGSFTVYNEHVILRMPQTPVESIVKMIPYLLRIVKENSNIPAVLKIEVHND